MATSEMTNQGVCACACVRVCVCVCMHARVGVLEFYQGMCAKSCTDPEKKILVKIVFDMSIYKSIDIHVGRYSTFMVASREHGEHHGPPKAQPFLLGASSTTHIEKLYLWRHTAGHPYRVFSIENTMDHPNSVTFIR